MYIKISIVTMNAGQCRGMRQWLGHCLGEFVRLNPSATHEVVSSASKLTIGGVENYITFGTDSLNTTVVITLESVAIGKPRSHATESELPPIAMLAFVLATLRHMAPDPGPSGEHDTLAFGLQVGKYTYPPEEHRASLARLKAYVSDAWYLPFFRKISSPTQYFAKTSGR